VQNARKSAGLAVEDRIALTLGGDAELLDAAHAHEAYVAGEVLAVDVRYDGDGDGDGEAEGDVATIDGRPLAIGVVRA
jgi:isoleucyl-tRNA synthetase